MSFDNRLEIIRNVPAVTGCLFDRCRRRPAIIPDDEMDKFRFMLDFSEESVRFINAHLNPGDKIRVIKGPLAGLEGEMSQLEGKSQIMVRIEQLGAATVEIPVGYVEKI